MALIAYAMGRVSRTDWVWWLAPLTVAVDGSILLRARVSDSAAFNSPLDDPLFVDLDPRIVLASSAAATVIAALGAFGGNRPVIVAGAVLAILGRTLERTEETTGAHNEQHNEPLRLTGAGLEAAIGRDTGGALEPRR